MAADIRATLRIPKARYFGFEGMGLAVAAGGIAAREWFIAALGAAGVFAAAWLKAATEARKPSEPPPGPPRRDLMPRLNELDVEAERWIGKLARPDAGNFTSLALTWCRETERWFGAQGLTAAAEILEPAVTMAHRDYARPLSGREPESLGDIRLAVAKVRGEVRATLQGIEAQIAGR